MTMFNEMIKPKDCGALMIEHDVSDTRRIIVPRDAYCRRKRMGEMRRVYRDQPFNTAFHQELWIPFKQLRAMVMADNEVKVTLLEQMLLDPAKDLGRIAAA